MEYDFQFIEEANCVAIRIVGQPTSNEMHQGLIRLSYDPQWKSRIAMLVDCRETEFTHLSASDVRELAQTFTQDLAEFRPGSLAIVVNGLLAYGLARMWEILVRKEWSLPLQVFHSLGEALEWLEIPDIKITLLGYNVSDKINGRTTKN